MNPESTGRPDSHLAVAACLLRRGATHGGRTARRARSREGFSLAELIVAIALLTVGLGALASTSSYLIYETAASRRAELAANLARTRLELLRLGPCGTTMGTATHQGLSERWTVSAEKGSAIAAVTISYRERGQAVVQHYRSALPC